MFTCIVVSKQLPGEGRVEGDGGWRRGEGGRRGMKEGEWEGKWEWKRGASSYLLSHQTWHRYLHICYLYQQLEELRFDDQQNNSMLLLTKYQE